MRLSVLFLLLIVGMTSTAIRAQDIPSPEFVSSIRWNAKGNGLLVSGLVKQGQFGLWVYDSNLRPIHLFTSNESIGVGAVWSPDGTRFAMDRQIVDAQTFEVLVTIKVESRIEDWNEDGTRVLAWADENSLALFDSNTGALVRQVATGYIANGMAWSPDKKFILIRQPTAETDIIQVADGQKIIALNTFDTYNLRWSPDSRYIVGIEEREVAPRTPGIMPFALGSRLASVKVWDVFAGKVIYTYSGLISSGIPEWHPFKSEIVIPTYYRYLYVWNLETGEMSVLKGSQNIVRVEYSPFGGRLFMGGSGFSNDALEEQIEQVSSILQNIQANQSESLIDDVLEIVVPFPSVDLLDKIEATCIPTNILLNLPFSETLQIDTQYITAYIEAVHAETSIPAGCAADLIAVAEALQTKHDEP